MRGSYPRLLSAARLPNLRKRTHWNPQGRRLRGEPLFRNGVSSQELQAWRRAIQATDIDKAMSIIEETKPLIAQPDRTESLVGYEHMDELDMYDGEAPLHIRKLPTWVVVYIASHKVRTPAQASGALLHLVFNQLPLTPPQFRPSLLVIVALSLAKYSLLVPMRRLLS